MSTTAIETNNTQESSKMMSSDPPSRKREAEELEENQGQQEEGSSPVANKKRKVFSFGGNAAWWKFGEYAKDVKKSVADHVTSSSNESSSLASRIVSTDNLVQPSPRLAVPQASRVGVSNYLQSIQQHPSTLRNALFRPVAAQPHQLGQQHQHQLVGGVPSQVSISNAFFRPEQVYQHQEAAHHTGNVSVYEQQHHELEHDDDCSEGDSSAIKFRAYQAENWTERFEELIEFRQVFGHCLVPNAFPENPPLAQWVKRQRYQYKLKIEGKRSTMSDERVAALEEVGFVWDSHSAVWDERLHDLLDYKQMNGDCNVPSRYAENRQLAVWVKRQRRQYKFYCDNQPSSMTEDRINRLNAVGFEWDLKNKKN